MMPIASNHVLNRTLALRHRDVAAAAIAALEWPLEVAEVEALAEIVLAQSPAKLTLAALNKLASCETPLQEEALAAALCSSFTSVRVAAAGALAPRASTHQPQLLNLLSSDHSWSVRREVVRGLFRLNSPPIGEMLAAVDDPHWRVRHALVGGLLDLPPDDLQQVIVNIEGSADQPLVQGMASYLRFKKDGHEPEVFPSGPDPEVICPFWSWDAAVLARNLDKLGRDGRRNAIDLLPQLAAHDDARVRRLALQAIGRDGETPQLVSVVALLDEPRRPAIPDIRKFLSRLDLDRTAVVVRSILSSHLSSATQQVWAIEQCHQSLGRDEAASIVEQLAGRPDTPSSVLAALVRLIGAIPAENQYGWVVDLLQNRDETGIQLAALSTLPVQMSTPSDQRLEELAQSADADVRAATVRWFLARGNAGRLDSLSRDGSPHVRLTLAKALVESHSSWAQDALARLRQDWHPYVRASAHTQDSARCLMNEPAQETSWHVLERACRICKIPLWQVAPQPPWKPPAKVAQVRVDHKVTPRTDHQTQSLGPERLPIAPLGVSGHYNLPAAGFAKAMEAGVNLMFWEPGYQSLNAFAASLSINDRQQLVFMTGTFHAEADNLRNDLERCLKHLQIDRLDLFLVFWVQSWNRITDEMRHELEKQQQAGKLNMFGLSTHNRPLSVEAMQAGWDPIMARHSAAHRGAEAKVLPTAVRTGATLISFNNTCYGRLLGEHKGYNGPPISAADCYRYTLAQPGVTACLTAPGSMEELDQNLAVLTDPTLSQDKVAALRAAGDVVYREETLFRKLIRSL